MTCRLDWTSVSFSILVIAGTVCAQQAPPSLSSKAASSISIKSALPDPGEITNSLYRNPFFGFTCKIPFGWVNRTDEMRQDSGESAKSILMLAVFKHPPEATGNTVNSAVVIAAESVSSYPGLTNPAQYFGPLTEVSTAKGLKPVNEPYEFPVDAKPIVRRDFMKQVGTLAMHQSTLAMLKKGYVLSFTFIGSSDDEVTALIESLAFGKVKGPTHK